MVLYIKAFLIVNVLLLLNTLTECAWSCDIKKKERWSYNTDTNGPNEWGNSYPNCSTDEQSPVDIDCLKVKYSRSIQKLNFTNYDKPVTKARIENVGSQVVVTPLDSVTRTIEVDNVIYRLRQFHFHWGDQKHGGSEHTLNGKRYAMEVHFFNMDPDRRLVMLAGFFDCCTMHDNAGLKPIADVLSRIPYWGGLTSTKDDLDLMKLLPSNVHSFYRYMGSRMTPPCDNGVVWYVMKKPLKIGTSQLTSFNQLYSVRKEDSTPECRISGNFRPLQPLNNREIIYAI